MEVQLSPTIYNGGYHIRCHGGADGTINTILIGGDAPFSFSWSNGATTQLIQNIAAGTYTVTVTQSGGYTATASITLREPQTLDPSLYSPVYAGGTHISTNGDSDGTIELTDQGGTPPYEYLWSNASVEQNQYDLAAGTYTVTVTDVNTCTQIRSITLTEPAVLSISSITSPDFNGFNIHCNDAADGSINLTVTGGVAPYEILWNNGSFEEDPSGLPAGEYAVRVIDQNQTQVESSITLTEPPVLTLELVPFVFPNNYNISLFGGYDGSITTNAGGGVAPITFLWDDATTTQNRTTLNHGIKSLVITDANGCTLASDVTLLEPGSADWMRNGNTGTDPNNQFIGTVDSTDFVFRTNNKERLTLKGSGTLQLKGQMQIDNGSTDSIRLIYADQNGILKTIPGGGTPSCNGLTNHWFTDYCNHTNDIYNNPFIGNVGIGTSLPQEKLHVLGNAIFTSTPPPVSSGISSPMIHGSYTYSNATSPDYTWLGNANTGLFHPSANVLAITNNGTESMRINNTGWVGIGTTMPKNSLDIKGAVVIGSSSYAGVATAPINGLIVEGSVGIGIIPNAIDHSDSYKLVVAGKFGANEIWTSIGSPWPDFIFKSDYKLKSFDELQMFININHHLPGMPSDKELASKNKINVGDIQIKQQEKLEEAYLYILQLKKEQNKMNIEIEALKKQIKN